MILEHDRCIYCQNPLYTLHNGHVKCATCKRKYSPMKLERDFAVIDAFVAGESAHAAANRLGLNYQSIATRYHLLRALAAADLERRYSERGEEVAEFEEYLYLEASRRSDPHALFDAHNFITFCYGARIYNVLLPSLRRFGAQMMDDGADQPYRETFKSFMRNQHIARLRSRENRITEFWAFFEGFIKRYKGVSEEQFGLYLKEAEFRFNDEPQIMRDTLRRLWIDHK
ncbi:MAG: transposase [Campylobacterales bacterium]|nr:transposase [Campylobacterales bacterium]